MSNKGQFMKKDNIEYPNWFKAKYLVYYLIDTIKDISEDEAKEVFDRMLDKQTWSVLIEICTNDSVTFNFAFIKEETPSFGFDDTTSFIEDNNEKCFNVLNGIPYPVLFAMNINVNKKNAILTYLNTIKDVLIWQTIILLDKKYEKYPKNSKIKGYNNPKEINAYTGQLLSMVNELGYNNYKELVNCVEKGKEFTLLYLDKNFEKSYACKNLREFIVELTNENYMKLIDYIKSQDLFMKE